MESKKELLNLLMLGEKQVNIAKQTRFSAGYISSFAKTYVFGDRLLLPRIYNKPQYLKYPSLV